MTASTSTALFAYYMTMLEYRRVPQYSDAKPEAMQDVPMGRIGYPILVRVSLLYLDTSHTFCDYRQTVVCCGQSSLSPRERAGVRGSVAPETNPLTLTLSQREGRPLSWAPSADAVAGGGDTAC